MTNVLVVDDELGIRETFQMLLEEEGYDVATAADFFEAESLLVERPFDVVVTDIIMPHVDGLALLQRVCEIDEDIPVIMITGEPDVSTAIEAVRHGAYDYIAKPVTLDMLLHVVGRAAERKRLLDDKHRLEAENLAYQADLERKVIERTVKLEQRRGELAALIEIGRDTSATLNLDKVMEIVAESVVTRLGYKVSLVSSYMEEDDFFTMRAMCPHSALLKQAIKLIGYDPWELKFSFDPQENPGFEQLLRGQVWLTTSFHDFVRPVLNKRVADALQRLYDIRHCICVPMWVRGKLVGAFVAASEAEIDTAAQEVLVSLARQAALAIENAHLFEAERAQLLLARTLQEVGALLTTRLSLDEVYQHIFDLLSRVIKYQSVSIQLVGEDGQLDLLVERGFPAPERHRQVAHELSNRTMELFVERKVIVIPDTHNDSRWVIAPCTEYIRSWIGAPLLVKGKFIGVLNVDSALLNVYDAAAGETVMAFANQAAIAIENARLFEEEISSRYLADTLREIAQALNSTLSLDEVLRLILAELGKVIIFDSGAIMLLEGADLIVRAVKGFADPDSVLEARLDLDATPLNREVVESKRPLIVGSVHEDGRWLKPMETFGLKPELCDIHSWMGVPLVIKGQVIGMLTTDKIEAHFYSEQDAEIALAFANQAVVAIENARLYEEAQRRLESLTNLNRASQVVTSSLDVKEVLEQVVELAGSVVDSDYTSVVLLDEAGEPALEAEDFRGVAPIARRIRGSGVARHVLDSGQPAIVDAISAEGAMTPPLQRPDGELMEANPDIVAAGIRSFVAVPIQAKGRMMGVAFVHSRQPRAFHGQVPLLTTFANQVAVAIENARLFEETQKHVARLEKKTRDLELVHHVSQVISSSLDLTRILEAAVEQMVEVFEADHSGILLFDQAQTYGQVVAEYPPSGATAEQFPVQGYLAAERIIAGREPLVIEDAWNDPLMATVREAMHRLDIRSMLIAPLIVKGEVLGSIGLDAVGRQRRFSAEEVALAQTIANQVAIAIENAHLFEEAQRRVHQLSTLNRVGRRVASILDRQKLLQQAVDAVRDDLGYFRAAVLLMDEGASELYVAAATDNFWRVIPDDYRQPVGKGAIGTAAQTGKTVLVDDASSDTHAYRVGEWFSPSSLSVPIQAKGRVNGVLEVEADTVNAFDEGDRAVLELMADQLSIAIENARLFEAEQQQRREAETLYRAAQALATTLDLRQVFECILGELQQVVPYDSASVQLLRGEQLEIIGGHGFPNLDDLLGITFDLSSENNPNGEVMRRRAPFIVEDAPAVYPRFREGPHAAVGIRAYLGVPLIFGDQLLGMLALDKREPGFYTLEHARLASAFAVQAAIAIENARLYEETKQRAEEMTALHETTLDITAQLEMPRLLDAIIARASDLLGATGGLIHLYDPARERLAVVTSYNLEKDYTGLTLEVGEGVAGSVFQTEEPLIIDDHRRWSGKSSQVADAAARSMIGVSLKWQERIIGVLDIIDNVRVGTFDEQDLRLLMPFANQAAIAIQNARLYAVQQQHAAQLESLSAIAAAISQVLDPDEVLNLIARQAAELVEAETVAISLLNDDGTHMTYAVVCGPLAADLAGRVKPLRDKGICTWVMCNQQAFYSDDLAADERESDEMKEALGLRTVISAPMVFKGKTTGAITAVNKQDGGLFTRADLEEYFKPLADHAAIAFENARLFEAEQQRRREAETLYRATQALATTLDLSQVFERILSELQQVVPYDSATVQLLQDGRLEIIGGRGFPNLDELLGITFDLSKEDNPNREVIHQRTSFIVDDAPVVYQRFRRDPHAAAGIHAWLGVPLMFGDRLIGMLALDKQEACFYTTEHARLAEAFAAQAAIAIESARLYDAAQREIVERKRAEQALQERATRLELIARMGQRTTAILELDELLDQAANLIGDAFDYYNVNVFLVEGDEIVLRASTFPSYRPSEKRVCLRMGAEGITGWVAANGDPLLVPDVSVEPRYCATLEGIETKSELAVPIRLKGIVIGVLDVQSNEIAAFSQPDLFTLQTIAGQLAIAIENARLYEGASRHVDELVALHNIDMAITSVLDPDEVLQVVYEQASEIMNVSSFYIGLYDEEQGELYFPLVVEEGERLSLPALLVGEGGGLNGWVVRTRQPLWIEDMEKERDTLPVEPVGKGVPPRSLMMWPLIARDKVIGVISAQFAEPYAFDEDNRRFFSGIANQVAIAVENARLFEETNRRLDELSFLHDVALTAAVALDFDEILRRTVEAVNNRLNLEVFGFLLVDEDADLIRLHPTFLGVPDEMVDFSTPLGEGITGWVAQTGQPLLAPDVSQEPRYLDIVSDIRSEVCVPLKVGDRVIGVINAESTQLNAFSEDDVRLFSTLASQLGMVLDNARLFEETNRRLVEARLIQEVMLAAASTLDFDLVLERTIKALNRALGIERLSFLLPDERNGVLAPHPSLVGFAGAAFQIPIKGSLIGRAYRTGQPVLVRNLARKPAYERRAPDVCSVLAVPVRIANRIAAVLHAESSQAGAFGEDELLLFVTIAGQLGVTLNNAQLYQRLQEVNRLRTELVQNVGHELRTPLGLIKGYVELLRNGDLGPILDDQRAALQIVHQRTITLTRLIRNLTVLQALPREALVLAPVSLVAVARHVLEEFRGSAAGASITFLEELPAELPAVMGDWEQLKLAFGHLLDNAIKFSPGGGVVAIRAWAELGLVCVSIADEGIGISSEHLEHIFERFYQVDGSASRRFGGMGVGLALVWEVIEAHGGTVSVDSKDGKGSTFTVALPQATGSENS